MEMIGLGILILAGAFVVAATLHELAQSLRFLAAAYSDMDCDSCVQEAHARGEHLSA